MSDVSSQRLSNSCKPQSTLASWRNISCWTALLGHCLVVPTSLYNLHVFKSREPLPRCKPSTTPTINHGSCFSPALVEFSVLVECNARELPPNFTAIASAQPHAPRGKSPEDCNGNVQSWRGVSSFANPIEKDDEPVKTKETHPHIVARPHSRPALMVTHV